VRRSLRRAVIAVLEIVIHCRATCSVMRDAELHTLYSLLYVSESFSLCVARIARCVNNKQLFLPWRSPCDSNPGAA